MADKMKGDGSQRKVTSNCSNNITKLSTNRTETMNGTSNGQNSSRSSKAINNFWCGGSLYLQPYDQWKVPYEEIKPKKLRRKLNKNIYYPCNYGGYGSNAYYNYYDYYYNCANPLYPALCNYYQQRLERLKTVCENVKFISSDLNSNVKTKKRPSSKSLESLDFLLPIKEQNKVPNTIYRINSSEGNGSSNRSDTLIRKKTVKLNRSTGAVIKKDNSYWKSSMKSKGR